MNQSWKNKVNGAFIVMAAAMAVMVVACAREPARTPLVVQDAASAAVNRMHDVKVLDASEVLQVSVLCEQQKPNDPFRVVVGYWPKKLGSLSVHTDVPCNSWGQVMFVLPTEKSGWQVHAATPQEAKAAQNYIRMVALALLRRNT